MQNTKLTAAEYKKLNLFFWYLKYKLDQYGGWEGRTIKMKANVGVISGALYV